MSHSWLFQSGGSPPLPHDPAGSSSSPHTALPLDSQHTLPDCNNATESSTEWVPQVSSGAREPQRCDPQVENCKTMRSDLLSHSADQSWGPGRDRPDLSLPCPQRVPCLGHQMAPRFHDHQDCGIWEGGFRIPPLHGGEPGAVT